MEAPTAEPASTFAADAKPPPPAGPAISYAAGGSETVLGGALGTAECLTALLVALLLVAILFLVAWRLWGEHCLANSLAARGWVLYTRPGCSYCTQQLNLLGQSYPKQVVCAADSSAPAACAKVPAYPYWVNEQTSDTRTGLQNLEQLTAMLGAT